jgi:uncharacterized protein (TIRG00374 family)
MSVFKVVREHPLKFLISIVISVVAVYFSFRGLDWQAFWEAIQNIQLWWLALGGVLLVSSNLLRAARWRILLSNQKLIPRYPIFKAVMVGYLANNILPFKLGELLRAVIVARQNRLPVSGVGASVVVERGTDMLSFLVIIAIYSVIMPTLEVAKIIGMLGLVGIVALLIFAAWMSRHHDRFFAKVEAWSERKSAEGHERWGRQVVALFKGLETIWRMPRPLTVTIQSFVLWFVYLLVTLCGVFAFQFDLTMVEKIDAAIVMLIFTSISLAVPAAPGYVGTYHGAAMAALLLFGIGQDAAGAFAVVMHLLNYLLYTPIGAYYLAGMGIKLTSVDEELPENAL